MNAFSFFCVMSWGRQELGRGIEAVNPGVKNIKWWTTVDRMQGETRLDSLLYNEMCYVAKDTQYLYNGSLFSVN